MKICWQGFLAKQHSWSVVAQNICRSFISKGNEVDLLSTNGLEFFPKDLEPNLKSSLGNDYDIQLSYTALKNFPNYFSHGNGKKFGIWCYEFAGKNSLPAGFAKNYKYCDKLLPPSQFAKQVFIDSGIPDDHMVVVPHGIQSSIYADDTRGKYPLNTSKFKILVNVAQPHIRKNLKGILETFGKAFSKKDDVILILKVVDKPATEPFEIDFKKTFTLFKQKFPNHAEVKIINTFIENIDTLYRACDVLFSLSHAECFLFPALEMLATGGNVIAPNWGGQTDFLNNKNSLLVEGHEINAPAAALYWEQKSGTKYFSPNIDDAVDKIRSAYISRVRRDEFRKDILEKYSWDNIVDQISNL